MNRDEIIKCVLNEREKFLDHYGSEFDSEHTPNDWMSIITHYVNRESTRINFTPDKDDFEDSFIKAAAIIIAALEHVDIMEKRKLLK